MGRLHKIFVVEWVQNIDMIFHLKKPSLTGNPVSAKILYSETLTDIVSGVLSCLGLICNELLCFDVLLVSRRTQGHNSIDFRSNISFFQTFDKIKKKIVVALWYWFDYIYSVKSTDVRPSPRMNAVIPKKKPYKRLVPRLLLLAASICSSTLLSKGWVISSHRHSWNTTP